VLGALQSPKAQVLTSRQIGVIRRVAEGKTNREIADEFRLSERTVDRHVSNILMRLDVPNRSAAVKYAITHGLVKD
jgi:DNA-binding NarL/FixJ family response regulator